MALVAADFNLDGTPDVVVANETDDTISVFLGLGDGTLLSLANCAHGQQSSSHGRWPT